MPTISLKSGSFPCRYDPRRPNRFGGRGDAERQALFLRRYP